MNNKLKLDGKKIKLMKIIVLIILSNVLFFMLFSGDHSDKESNIEIPTIPQGYGLLRIEAQLKTRFESHKPISLLDTKNHQFYNKAILWEELKNENLIEAYLILVPEKDVIAVINFKNIVIYPFLKSTPQPHKTTHQGSNYEIHY